MTPTHDQIASKAYELWALLSTGGGRDNFRAMQEPPEWYWQLAEYLLRRYPE